MPSNVYGVIPDADGEPAQGTITFRPTAYRGADDGESLLGRSPVKRTLDEDGEFDVDLESGNYFVDIRLRGAPTFTREISVADGDGSVNIKTLLEDYLEDGS
jgi:hypothetical protein